MILSLSFLSHVWAFSSSLLDWMTESPRSEAGLATRPPSVMSAEPATIPLHPSQSSQTTQRAVGRLMVELRA